MTASLRLLWSTAKLSREGRDTLWLLAALLVTVAPHLPRLPWWCASGVVLAMAWRAQLAWRDAPLPPRWVTWLALAACLALTWRTHHSLMGREAGITLVTVLAALKTLELRARRDALVITCLGFFLVLTQFLYSQSIVIAALMLLATLAWLSSLILAQRPIGRPSIWSAWRTACLSMLLGLPLMVMLFLFFPRFGPLWRLPGDAGPRTGLSDDMKLGHVAELALDDSIAMRVRFASAAPPPQKLYFRGPVLEQFDGQTWTQAPRDNTRMDTFPTEPEPHPNPSQLRDSVSYQASIEPSRLRSMALLDGTFQASPTPPLREPKLVRIGRNWLATQPLSERAQIDAKANWMASEEDMSLSNADRHRLLALPLGVNPRTMGWTRDFSAQSDLVSASADQKVLAVLRYIRQENFRYTLSPDADLPPGTPPSPHQIDRFWLDQRAGFCEHFASAMVVVLRNMGVPARIVTGYQGAEKNPFDDWLVVRNSDAHAWAEYWSDERGWVRVDPTAAVAPERIERPRRFDTRARNVDGALPGLDAAYWHTARAYLEAANHRWNMWVQSYSRQQQLALLEGWGVSEPDWQDLLRLSAAGLVLSSVVGGMWLWWQRPVRRQSPWQKRMWQLHKTLLPLTGDPPPQMPLPAPALAWARYIEGQRMAPSTLGVQRELIARLHELDRLRYAHAPHLSEHQSQKAAQAEIRSIYKLVKSWQAHANAAPSRRADQAH